MTYITNSEKQYEGCVFCVEPRQPDSPQNLIIHRGRLAYVILNRYPYTSGHLMIVPYQHCSALEDLEPGTRAELMELAAQAVQTLSAEYHPQGFNLGMNIGEIAGAGIAAHVHLHIVVTAGGLNPAGTRWIPAKNNFLVPVRALAKLLRGKFLDGLQAAFGQGHLLFSPMSQHLQTPPAFKRLIRNMRRIRWYAYSKLPFDDPEHVFSYLGHNTHRTAISNQRLLAFF